MLTAVYKKINQLSFIIILGTLSFPTAFPEDENMHRDYSKNIDE